MGIDIAAPGESMVVAAPRFLYPSGYATGEGTSFSTSLVSAAAAWVATRRGAKIRQLADLLRSSARDVAPAGWDADTGYGILDIPSALRKPLPAVDPHEPNDDMNQVTAMGILKREAPALTRPGRARATLRARLDRTEDPVDVYRVYVPAHRQLRLRIVPTSNVDIEVFRPRGRSCYYQSRSRALHGPLIGGRYGRGTAPETFPVRNTDSKASTSSRASSSRATRCRPPRTRCRSRPRGSLAETRGGRGGRRVMLVHTLFLVPRARPAPLARRRWRGAVQRPQSLSRRTSASYA
jgi:hypothetical protein